MAKIVYNDCYGGFGLSTAAIKRYAELKGLTLYPEEHRFSMLSGPTYWTVPLENRPLPLEGEAWHLASSEERAAYSRAREACTLYHRDISRTDTTLVQVIEELGKSANGRASKLAIAEVPAGVRYVIEEYDGLETVRTVEDFDWQIAV